MGKNLFVGVVIIFFSFGCATQSTYNLRGCYISKNKSLNLVSKLDIFKSGTYVICTSTLDHENENSGDGNYYCIEGIWNQQKNKVTLTANTWEGNLGVSPPENGSIAILEHAENLANPETLLILQPSGATMSDISVAEITAEKINAWTNYQRCEYLH